MLTDKIKQELEKGFSIRDLEILIGLPKNSLSSVLSGKKKLSKVSQRKSERYLENPTDFFEYLAIKELNKKVVNSMEKSNFPDTPKETNQMRGVLAAMGSEIKSTLKSPETKKESKVDSSFEVENEVNIDDLVKELAQLRIEKDAESKKVCPSYLPAIQFNKARDKKVSDINLRIIQIEQTIKAHKQ